MPWWIRGLVIAYADTAVRSFPATLVSVAQARQWYRTACSRTSANAASDAPLEMVERRLLRHRVLHTKAFVHVSKQPLLS